MTAFPSTFVIGAQKSGKSRYAEGLVLASGLDPVYMATATAGDAEMVARIAAHRARRGEKWCLIEEPVDIGQALSSAARPQRIVLVECLTLWLANLMQVDRPVEAEFDALADALNRISGPVVLVSNEVGAGIVPDNQLARRYADHLGTLNQKVAAVADKVVLVAAGLPLVLKPARTALAS